MKWYIGPRFNPMIVGRNYELIITKTNQIIVNEIKRMHSKMLANDKYLET